MSSESKKNKYLFFLGYLLFSANGLASMPPPQIPENMKSFIGPMDSSEELPLWYFRGQPIGRIPESTIEGMTVRPDKNQPLLGEEGSASLFQSLFYADFQGGDSGNSPQFAAIPPDLRAVLEKRTETSKQAYDRVKGSLEPVYEQSEPTSSQVEFFTSRFVGFPALGSVETENGKAMGTSHYFTISATAKTQVLADALAKTFCQYFADRCFAITDSKILSQTPPSSVLFWDHVTVRKSPFESRTAKPGETQSGNRITIPSPHPEVPDSSIELPTYLDREGGLKIDGVLAPPAIIYNDPSQKPFSYIFPLEPHVPLQSVAAEFSPHK